MPAYLVTLITGLVIGLVAGALLGFLFSRLKSTSSVADRALLDDYKSQLDAERGKTESAVKLNAELVAVKESNSH
jgi:DNA recombination protein RmuC